MGMTFAGGVGTGIPAASAGGGPMVSNATSVSEQGGPFVVLGGSGQVGLSAGGDIAIGNGPNNGNVIDLSSTVGTGVRLPAVEVGGEVHGFMTYTLTWTWFDWHF